MVRFRLKKSLPFDVDKAKVSYHAQPASGTVRVVAAVALNSVVEEYESVFADAGYNPGVVLPSMLAALGAAKADRPTLVVKVDARTISIAILDQQQLLLFRTLENAARRHHHRRTAGGRDLSLGCVLSGHLSPEHRADFCRRSCPTWPERRPP